MAKVSTSVPLAAPAGTVWELVGAFDGLAKWHPAFVACEESRRDGVVTRRLTLADGATILERLEERSDRDRICRYSIVDSPLPITGYVSDIRVHDRDGENSCEVEWACEFTPVGATEADMTALIRNVYQTGLDSLKHRFG